MRALIALVGVEQGLDRGLLSVILVLLEQAACIDSSCIAVVELVIP